MAAMLTPREVAEQLQLSMRTVYDWLRAGDLPAARFGSAWRVDPKDLDEFIRERSQGRSKDKRSTSCDCRGPYYDEFGNLCHLMSCAISKEAQRKRGLI